MLRRIVDRNLRSRSSIARCCSIGPLVCGGTRQLATSTPDGASKPKEVYTKLSDLDDPARSKFFQYSWGSWLQNDKLQKKQRETVFSIEGLTSFLHEINTLRSSSTTPEAPKEHKGIFVLQNNVTDDIVGDKENSPLVKSISSIHEGKHHRIYKVSLANGKELVLRIPYKLDSDAAIASKIRSEVATMDFLDLKLNLNVPKVVAYGPTRNNEIGSPFMLQEFIEGELLMKKWHPLEADSEKTESNLKQVIDPIAKFQDKVLSPTFTKFGSLYFYNDVSLQLQEQEPYEGETNEALAKRWRIGKSVEKHFTKGKNKLPQGVIDEHSGPWDASNPLEVMSSVANIELENAKHKLAIVDADAGDVAEKKDLLKDQITTFEHLKQITPKLLNPKSKSIKNVEKLFQPKLYVPDLDPLNVIDSTKGEPYFIDFEGSTIKPFVLTSYPNFVAYHGAKVYNLKEDIPGFDEMDPVEKQQYEFMYYKTRNERLWEVELNKNRHELIAIASPHLKVLKSPYLQALDLKHPKDYLYVEGSIIQLQAMWEAYVANELANQDSNDKEFPVKYDETFLDQHQSKLSEHQLETVSSPFGATGGWLPQDMFDTLKQQGIIVDIGDGNYKIDTEPVLKEPLSEAR
ncbi:AIM9 [Candida oxycetoniae]|uniref:Altered inheritance of mitochondria protein 9, mitochondrial n=1 Tax=Candida oxycetoniae TaxID=497107 RepID=A0AAI9SZ85_9ASCO|nr:AIM9 [Candida oxycetoniae]KAI3405341.2 AIM9 [Candida oxycetoniae]